MRELEKILEEIDIKISGSMGRKREGLLEARDIIRKHISGKDINVPTNNGWLPVEKFGLPHSNEHDFRFWVTIQYTNGFRHTIKAKWDCFDKCFIHQNGKKILQDVIAYKYYSAPEPYNPERSAKE